MRLRILSLLLGSCFALTTLAADKPVDVRDLMTATQFHTTGLDKLTPQELAAFNAWFAAYGPAGTPAAAPAAAAPAAAAVPVPVAAPAVAAPLASATAAPAASSVSSFGKEMLPGELRGEPKRIESQIVGTFNGWHGNTLFKLANGQVWQQTDTGTYDSNLQNPPVVIKRLGFGYLLTLTGHGATVFVKRVQ